MKRKAEEIAQIIIQFQFNPIRHTCQRSKLTQFWSRNKTEADSKRARETSSNRTMPKHENNIKINAREQKKRLVKRIKNVKQLREINFFVCRVVAMEKALDNFF